MASKFLDMLTVLERAGVDFILVGGVSAVLRGAPLHTFDIDIVHDRAPGNVERLLAVLADLEAVYRAQPERQLRPTATHLAGAGHQNLITRLGPLDLLGSIGQNLNYADLLPESDRMAISDSVSIRVLRLAAYIKLKEELGGEKDRAALPVLRQTLRESGG